MSEIPSTPPEISTPPNVPAESLLERLRKITGITELPEILQSREKPDKVGAPVDRLIPALRDGFAALAACGIALAVTAATGAIWAWGRGTNLVHRAGGKRSKETPHPAPEGNAPAMLELAE